MNIKRVNIGLLIEQKMNELCVTKSELARRCGIANQNINRVFCRDSIDTEKLVSISEALDYNFFLAYTDDTVMPTVCHHNQYNEHGSHDNVNGEGCAVLQERVKALEALLAEKERLIKVYEKMMKE